MSKYTTELRHICESLAGHIDSKGYDDIQDIVVASAPKIFSFDFPIFDEDYRLTLETKILKHYYTREIGEETYGLWKLRLDTKLNEIMPYYNKLYESELLKFNPLWTTDITVDHKGSDNSNVTSDNATTYEGSVEDTGATQKQTSKSVTPDETTTTSDKWNLYSDTPQGGIKGIEHATDAETLGTDAYLTNATHDKDSTKTTSKDGQHETETTNIGKNTRIFKDRVDSNEGHSFINNTDEYITKTFGYRGGNASRNLNEFRKTFLNIDMQIINELKDLFLNLW